MPHISFENHEVVFKVVYYGPGMSGKTTNLSYIHGAMSDHLKSEMIVLETAQERTIFFDFLPLEFGSVEGYAIRFNMFTVPGQIYYEASRRLIMDGADGVVFVADSQPSCLERNLIIYDMMIENLRHYNREPSLFPTVLQYNKRDCASPLPVGTLERELKLDGIPVFEAVAVQGTGVMETLKAICRQVIERFQI